MPEIFTCQKLATRARKLLEFAGPGLGLGPAPALALGPALAVVTAHALFPNTTSAFLVALYLALLCVTVGWRVLGLSKGLLALVAVALALAIPATIAAALHYAVAGSIVIPVILFLGIAGQFDLLVLTVKTLCKES